MILYDKNGTFLGINQDELFALGYDDMNDFTSHFSDFADLFINRPGYISKFKNFFWIDYMLHSGTPNKNVILKHKNGAEIESGLIVSEMFLTQEINNCKSIYCVELSILNGTQNSAISKKIENSQQNEESIFQDTSIGSVENFAQKSQEEDLTINDSYDKEISFGTEDTKEYPPPFQTEDDEQQFGLQNEQTHLKIPADLDEGIDDNFRLKINLDDDYLSDEKVDTPDMPDAESLKIDEEAPLIRSGAPVFNQDIHQEEVASEEIDDVYSVDADTLEPVKTPDIQSVDFIKIAENTGMDLGDIATFISEFISESKEYLSKFKDNEILDVDFARNEAIKLKSIATNLQMSNISSTLDSILQSSDSTVIIKFIKEFQMQIENLEEQLI